MLNIYYGRESVDQEKFIIDSIDLKKHSLIIVPDQYTLEAERRIFRETGAKALLDVDVLSMSRLGYRLLSELGGAKRTFIDQYGRHMILSRVTAENKDRLKVFRGLENKASFLEMVNNFISEMKQHNAGLEELHSIKDKLEENTYVYRKMSDMALIYEEYEKRIKGKYTDSEDYINLFLSKIGESELIRDSEIWIYGFDSFAPKAISVIGELMSYAKNVNVALTSSKDPHDRDSDIFELSHLVMHNLRNAAEMRSIEVHEAEIPGGYEAYDKSEKYDAVRHIEREIYALPARPYLGSENTPILVEASNLYNEAENAAAYILHLIRDEGYRYRDILVILNDMDVRGPIVRRVFEEYGLDLFNDGGRNVDDNPIIRYIMALFMAVLEKLDTKRIIAMLKTGMTDLDHDEVADLENYVIKYRIKGSMWKKPFTRGTFEYDEEEMKRLNDLREKVVAPCLALEGVFRAETYSEFITGLYGFLRDDIDLVHRIETLEKAQMDEGREDLAEETDQVWDAFLRIAEQINEIMGNEPFDGNAMKELLEVGLSDIKVGMLPPSKDGLIMGTMQRTRTGRVRALVVLGANEGVLPSGKPSQGIFGDEEKLLFKDSGIELLKMDSIALMEEKMGIYRNLSRSGEKLYMSCSISDLDGNSLKPSPIFLKMREIFPNGQKMEDAVSTRDMKFLMNGETSGLRHIANSLEKATEGETVEPEILEGLNWYKVHEPEKLEAIRNGIGFTNKAEELGRDMAAKLFKKDPEKDMSISPSRIEKFTRCPFSHFVSYGLNPQERRVFEVAPREIGDVCHACLMQFTEKLSRGDKPFTDPESPWMTITDEEIEEMIRAFLEETEKNYRGGLFKLGNEEIYRSDRVFRTCVEVAKNLVEQVRAGRILDGKYEVRFGRGREIPPIVIKLDEKDGGDTVYIEGVIDRVDYLPDSRVKIIDYKTGREEITIKEAEKGYRLQLMLYLKAALEDRMKPAGVFYFRIKEPEIDMTDKVSKLKDEEERTPKAEDIKKAIAKEFKLNGIMVNDPEVIRSIAGEFSGNSDIVQIKVSKDGEYESTTKEARILSDEDFEKLKDTVSDTVAKYVAELLKGSTDIHPMKTKDTTACFYCGFKGICRFNTIFEGNRWNPIS